MTNNNQLNMVIRLRRDNDYNFNKIADTWVPLKGEPILVDTASQGLRLKVGNGADTYGALPFEFNSLVSGYFFEDNFYSDSLYQNKINIEDIANQILFDNNNHTLLFYNGESFLPLIDTASDTNAGISFLYSSLGSNTNGSITQKTITEELSSRYKTKVDSNQECLIFY